ncbi:NAC domain-containing protein 43 [Linum perenne]
MHEYRLDDATTPDTPPPPPPHINGMIMSNVVIGEGGSEEGWVVCRVFRKKNYQKSLESPRSSSGNSSSSILHHMDSKSHILMNSPSAARYGGSTDGVLDQILMYMGRRNATTTSTSTSTSTTCKAENDYSSFSMGSSISNSNTNIISGVVGGEGGFIHLPRLVVDQQQQHQQQQSFGDEAMLTSENNNNNDNYNAINNNETSSAKQGTGFDVTPVYRTGRGGGGNGMIVNDWVALDRLVASQLNGHLHNDVVDGNDNDDDHEDMQMEDEQFRSILNHVVVPAGGRQQHQLIYSSERENDIWTNFNNHSSSSPSSSSDPLCHLSV